MSRKAIGILIILAGLIVIIGIIYFVFFYNFNQAETEHQESATTQTGQLNQSGDKPTPEETSPTETQKPAAPAPAQRIVSQEELKRMAASFAERFGSYSNHSSYGNIYDLEIFMSKNMQSWADKFVAEARSKQKSGDIYYGISTRAIHEEIKELDEDAGRAVILVNTQRRESTGTMGNSATFYQDILINFVKENGLWKVDSAHWEDK